MKYPSEIIPKGRVFDLPSFVQGGKTIAAQSRRGDALLEIQPEPLEWREVASGFNVLKARKIGEDWIVVVREKSKHVEIRRLGPQGENVLVGCLDEPPGYPAAIFPEGLGWKKPASFYDFTTGSLETLPSYGMGDLFWDEENTCAWAWKPKTDKKSRDLVRLDLSSRTWKPVEWTASAQSAAERVSAGTILPLGGRLVMWGKGLAVFALRNEVVDLEREIPVPGEIRDVRSAGPAHLIFVLNHLSSRASLVDVSSGEVFETTLWWNDVCNNLLAVDLDNILQVASQELLITSRTGEVRARREIQLDPGQDLAHAAWSVFIWPLDFALDVIGATPVGALLTAWHVYKTRELFDINFAPWGR